MFQYILIVRVDFNFSSRFSLNKCNLIVRIGIIIIASTCKNYANKIYKLFCTIILIACNVLVLNAFAGVDIHVLVSLYKIYVRSVLDYASIVYSPHFLYLIDLIENVQRNFTKRLSGLSNMSYAERLIVCNLEPLELRRIRTDMLFVYKLLNGIIKCNLIEYVKISDNMHNTRGNSKKLEKPYAKLLIRNNHFVVRCVNNWNSLTSDIVCAKSYNLFRKYVYMFNNFTLRGHAFNVS